MKRPWVVPIVLVALLALLLWLGSARLASQDPSRSGVLSLAARVRADEVVIAAPRLAAVPGALPSQPEIAGRLASVEVSAGARVEAGEVVARLDDAALALRVEQAKAVARGARARVGVVDANLDILADNAAELSDARRSLADALSRLRASRADVIRNLGQARALAASAPATLPPGAPDPRALVAQLEAALAKLDAGITKATAGRAKLDSGAAKLSDARSQLRGARGVLALVADAADAGVAVAESRRSLTEIRSPYAGTATWVAEAGTVLFAGGPVARVAPDGPLLLDTYVDADQARLIRLGASARAAADSWPGREFAGSVTRIRSLYEYPPTAVPTTRIHMTRAFQVTVRVDDTAAPLPPGTPADLTITTRSE